MAFAIFFLHLRSMTVQFQPEYFICDGDKHPKGKTSQKLMSPQSIPLQLLPRWQQTPPYLNWGGGTPPTDVCLSLTHSSFRRIFPFVHPLVMR